MAPSDRHTLEQRISRLETLLAPPPPRLAFKATAEGVSFLLMAAAVGLCVQGLGWPNHPYQIVLGTLTVALLYHRGWLQLPSRWHQWLLAPLNAASIAMLYKLAIGSGERHPLGWLKIPSIGLITDKDKWLSFVPTMQVMWEPSQLAQWTVDFTQLQTFLLLVTLLGGLFRLQTFVSLTSFLLLLSSLPALFGFDWHWVFPAVLVSGVGLYCQSVDARGSL